MTPNSDAAAVALSDYFAPCTLGLEEVLGQELRELGALEVQVRRGGVAFRGDRRLGYAANLWLRTAVRVQLEVARFKARGKDELYAGVREIEWERWLSVDGTLAVDGSVRDSEMTHSGFAALTVKDAICDRFRSREGRRPSVDVQNPTLPIKLVLARDQATLYINLSGESLHKRGWRPIQVKSPLNEAIAAGLLQLSGWDRKSPLVDPMCGSGTFLVEAAQLAADHAPGMQRRFAFERFPDFDVAVWAKLKGEAQQRAKLKLPFLIEGADRHGGAVSLAHRSVRAAGVEGMVKLSETPIAYFDPASEKFTVMVNPPWGERIGGGAELEQTWIDLGHFLHQRCIGSSAFVLSGNAELPRKLGLRAARKWPVMTGPIECRLLRYDVFVPPPEAIREVDAPVEPETRLSTDSSSPAVSDATSEDPSAEPPALP